MRSLALACAMLLACGACSSDGGGQTGGEDFTSAGSAGSAGAGGSPGACPGGALALAFVQAPGSMQPRCIDRCGWATILVDGAEVPLYDQAVCPRDTYAVGYDAHATFDGHLPSGDCLPPGNYIARMCSSEIQPAPAPPPDAAPAKPGDAAPMLSCVPGLPKCVDVPFTYPAAGGVNGVLTP